MGRIGESLSKLNLNSNVTSTPFKNMKAKEIIELCYHLAEVYDAEALLPETVVKKKLKVFKNFARVHSLIHLVPPVKEMKPKKCIRLVNSLLDTLEEKWGDTLYSKKSWPVACKELPKIEVTLSGGGYNLENLDLDPNAVPPGVTKRDVSHETRKFESSSGNNGKEGAKPNTSMKCDNLGKKQKKSGILSSAKPIHFEKTTNSVTSKGDIARSPLCLNGAEATVKNISMRDSGSVVKTSKQGDEMAQLESSSKDGVIVEVVGWSKAIYKNNRVWQAIKKVLFSRLLLGIELKKYRPKKIVPDEKILTTCGVTIEKKLSEEDLEVLKLKLSKLMAQISRLVPDNLSENIKCAVKTSCQNVTLRIKESDDSL